MQSAVSVGATCMTAGGVDDQLHSRTIVITLIITKTTITYDGIVKSAKVRAAARGTSHLIYIVKKGGVWAAMGTRGTAG